ncbi:hypothetical protein AAE121_005310, partial [Salmonella enterica]
HSDSFYPGVTPLPSGSLPVEVTNSFPNPFNTPLRLSSRFDNYHNKNLLHNEFDSSFFSTRSDDGWLIPLSRYDGISPFDILSLMDGRLQLIAGSADSNYFNSIELKSFHSDYNKGHSELMDYLNKKPSTPDYGGMENDFSSVVGGEMGKVTDSVKSLWDAAMGTFNDSLSSIDSFLPEVKTSFDLPAGFEVASKGRCIPVVLDFDIRLVGLPDYHFHAVGTQVCLLYDRYIRPVLNFIMVILSFFVIHRLIVRSAEFLSSGCD